MTWRVPGAALLALVACARLPDIAGNECGNGAIEAPEDCDTFPAASGALCRPRGSVGECHLDCTRSDNSPIACPLGWGCDLGGICRRPTGAFEPLREFEVGSAAALSSGDFDGDGKMDVVSLETPDPFGVTRVKFHYFDERAALLDTRTFPRALISPVVTLLPGDGASDLLFTDSRIGMLLGRADRSWVPETFSSYRIPNTALRTLSVFDAPVQDTVAFLVFAVLDGVPGIYVPDSRNRGVPRLLGGLDGPIDELAGDPVSGQLIEDAGAPCRQVALAVRGASQFWLVDACTRDAAGEVAWRSEVARWSIGLEPPAPIEFAPLVADINGDGHLDVLVGSAEQVYVAYGDGQTLATAIPFVLPSSDPAALARVLPMPLAAGDVTGDGGIDFVFSEGLLLSEPSSAPNQYDYFSGGAVAGGWSVATIADLNANGKLDVVGASKDRSGISFFNGNGGRDLTYFDVPTSRPVLHLAVGDFDGDFIQDLGITQIGAAVGAENAVLIGFGEPFGPPALPVAVARLENVAQMMSYKEGLLSHLVLSSSETIAEQPQGVLTLLAGSGDRIPVALYELTTFASDGAVDGSSAVRVVAGGFVGSERDDVLAVAFKPPLTDAALEFWLLPALATSAGTPLLLDGRLDPELHPVAADGRALRLATTTADLDADGRDEAILAMPGRDDDHCGLVVLGVERARVLTRTSLVLAQPCARPELELIDLDQDRLEDIVLMTGRADGTGGQLSVLWNDGAGNFDIEAQTQLGVGESVQAFAVLPATPARSISVAYATALGVSLVSATGAPRQLDARQELLPLDGCTGMTAADLDGDGAADLVLARRGNLNVLKATLESL